MAASSDNRSAVSMRNLLVVAMLVLSPAAVWGQSTVYAAVFAHETYTVGANNPTTGVFFRGTGDTVWSHCGARNVKAFDIDATRTASGAMLYLAAGNGVHVSADGGNSWKTTTGWRVADVLAVAVNRKRPELVCIGTAAGCFVSTNAGTTWSAANGGLGSTFVSDVAFTQSGDLVICSTEDGVYRSRVDHVAWMRCGLTGRRVRTILPHPANENILAAGTEEDGVRISTDLGTTWAQAAMPDSAVTIYALACDPVNPDRMFAGGYHTGVLRSLDGGKRWERLAAGIAGQTVHSIAIDPAEPAHVVAGTLGRGVFESRDGGERWMPAGLETAQVWTVRFDAR